MIDLMNRQIWRRLFDRPGEKFFEILGSDVSDGSVFFVANRVENRVE
jgi:hypothetical protein